MKANQGTLTTKLKSKTNLLDPHNSPGISNKTLLCICISSPGTHGNIMSPARPLLIWVLKRGRTKARRGQDCHWLTWGQLPVDDGQGSWC